jgi:hypothetical protein
MTITKWRFGPWAGCVLLICPQQCGNLLDHTLLFAAIMQTRRLGLAGTVDEHERLRAIAG